MTQEKISPLRARMIEDMRIRGMAETTQKAQWPASKNLHQSGPLTQLAGIPLEQAL